MQETIQIKLEAVQTAREFLGSLGYSFAEKEHAHFEARGNNCTVTVYKKGPKILIQGGNIQTELDKLRTHLGIPANMPSEAPAGTKNAVTTTGTPEPALTRALDSIANLREPERQWIGTDESGKGDYFGPLVTAGVCLTQQAAESLKAAGVMDSKMLSNNRIHQLCQIIKATPGVASHIRVLLPENYNKAYRLVQNLNTLLADEHAAVIQQLAEENPGCRSALTDQFAANTDTLESACRRLGVPTRVSIQQRPRAESDMAVAAASILARGAMLAWFEAQKETLPETPPLGGGDQSTECAIRLAPTHDLETLVKTHFKNHQKVSTKMAEHQPGAGSPAPEYSTPYDQLDPLEIQDMKKEIEAGMRTTNGDTAPITVTARQLGILLKLAKLD